MWHPFLSAVISFPVTGYFTLLYFISYNVVEEGFLLGFWFFTRKKIAKNKEHENSKDIAHVFIQYKKFNNYMTNVGTIECFG